MHRDGKCNILDTWHEHKVCLLSCCTDIPMAPGHEEDPGGDGWDGIHQGLDGLSAPACYKMAQGRQA